MIHYMEFKENIREVMELLKEITPVFCTAASNEAAARKEDAAINDPTRKAAMRDAIKGYYGSVHFQEYVDTLHKLAEVAEAGKPADLAKMEDCAHWLMLQSLS